MHETCGNMNEESYTSKARSALYLKEGSGVAANGERPKKDWVRNRGRGQINTKSYPINRTMLEKA